jgi:hypothetical protein
LRNKLREQAKEELKPTAKLWLGSYMFTIVT